MEPSEFIHCTRDKARSVVGPASARGAGEAARNVFPIARTVHKPIEGRRPELSPSPAVPRASDRLDSWKEIAAYLRREVRTVQRWEKHEGLPVRRHIHQQRSTIYAYKSELDDWWSDRSPQTGVAGLAEDDGRLRLTVLPSENLTNDPKQEKFSDGLTEICQASGQ